MQFPESLKDLVEGPTAGGQPDELGFKSGSSWYQTARSYNPSALGVVLLLSTLFWRSPILFALNLMKMCFLRFSCVQQMYEAPQEHSSVPVLFLSF